jgi:phytoene dehydrogenase-like protein
MATAAAPRRTSYDAVIVGGGHNGLVAAAYLAKAGRSVLVLERLGHTGGAAVSALTFPGVEARLSRYSYLVSLLPRQIIDELGLRFATRRRRISSYTPAERGGRPTGLLVDAEDPGRTEQSFTRLTGSGREFANWRRFYEMTGRVAERVFPTLTRPLPSRAGLRRIVADDRAWEALFERPLGEVIEETFTDDLVRGVVLTDALIGTFTHAHDPSLRQNRCFLYHVIGGGTGHWDVPVGGMGALTGAIEAAARTAGAEIVTGHEVTGIATDGSSAEITHRTAEAEGRTAARHVLAGVAPHTLAALLGEPSGEPAPEGSQLKINMLLRRLPRLREPGMDPREAFAGTFHIGESYTGLEHAYRRAAAGRLPAVLPAEVYCHSLSDPSILGPDLVARGFHTLTLFGLHAPARLFTGHGTDEAVTAALAGLDACLAEPIAGCLAVDADGRPCLEARGPLDLERDLAMPGGHIFHRDLAFPYDPYAPDDGDGDGRVWGVETRHPNVLLCGAGAIRGGGVSGIPGRNAAMAVLNTRP